MHNLLTTLTRRLALIALAATAAAATLPAQAGFVVFTDPASFEAALGAAAASDSFGDLTAGAVLSGPLNRSVAGLDYRARAVPVSPDLGAEDFFPVAPGGNTALSSNFADASLVFDQFSQPLRALAGQFFATNEAGEISAGGLTLQLLDADGSYSYALAGGSAPSFLGFISDSTISALTLSAAQPPGGFSYAAVDDLALAAATPVPEPAALPLALLGLAGLAGTRRLLSRRR